MSGYYERKAGRKQRRLISMLFEETGIVCSTEPTKNLLIGNAGLVTGLQLEHVLELFLPFGTVENIVMISGKSYCFVVFENKDSAARAYSALHGKPEISSDIAGPLYLAFSMQVPDVNSIWNQTDKPPGLIVMEDFVSQSEEEMLLGCVDWKESDSGQCLKNRRVVHYGYEFKYSINNVDINCPLDSKIPTECDVVFECLRNTLSDLISEDPDQLTVNEYRPGQGIPPHVDVHSAFGDVILSLSLGSSVVMDFRHRDGRHIPIVLPRRSLLVMSGEARYDWSHGITPRKLDVVQVQGNGLTVQKRGTRTSFTFRWVKGGECCCDYRLECDSYLRKKKDKVEVENQELAAKLEAFHVHKVYEEIAAHFSDTRHKPWPNVLEFVQDLTPGSVLVDVGCGNGKYFGHRTDIFEIGCDHSCKLAAVCKERGFQIFNCDCLSIPLRDAVADGCMSIAVIHHLSTKERRTRAIEEIVRVLVPNGKALIYVWAKNQERHKKKSSYLKQDRKNRRSATMCEDLVEASTNCSQVYEDRVVSDRFSDPNSDLLNNQNELLNLSSFTNRSQFQDQNGVVSESTSLSPDDGDADLSRNVNKFPNLPLHTNRTQFLHQDVLVPWKLKHGKQDTAGVPTFYRYYHVFEEGELEELCASLKDIHIVKSYYDQGNWCIVIQKKIVS